MNVTIKGGCANGNKEGRLQRMMVREALLEKGKSGRRGKEEMDLGTGNLLAKEGLLGKKKWLKTLVKMKGIYIEQTYYLEK